MTIPTDMKEKLEEFGEELGVKFAFPYPVMSGYELYREEDVIGTKVFCDGQEVGKVTGLGMHPKIPQFRVWFVEITNIDAIKFRPSALAGQPSFKLWDFPTLIRGCFPASYSISGVVKGEEIDE